MICPEIWICSWVLLGGRLSLLGTKGIATRSDRTLLGALLALLLGARTLLGARASLLGAPGIATRRILTTRSKDVIRNKKLLVTSAILVVTRTLLGTSASLLVTSAILVVTRFAIGGRRYWRSKTSNSSSCFSKRHLERRCGSGSDSILVPKQGNPHSLFST